MHINENLSIAGSVFFKQEVTTLLIVYAPKLLKTSTCLTGIDTIQFFMFTRMR